VASNEKAHPRKPAKLARSKVGNEDVALVWGKDESSGALGILRKRADRLETGIVQPLREGTPIHGEVIQMHAREGSPLYDVEVHLPAADNKAARGHATPRDDVAGRPAQVATDQYRENWDQIYRRSTLN
jgi:hypothetical protein